MEQHPIPQNISSYEFKLVGEMTLKQFLKAAAGIVLAVIFYSTKLIFFIKWPLVFGCAALGLALAFLPFEDRPLETWIMSFLKSIYSPTIYLYKKRAAANWLDIDWSKKLESDDAKKMEEEERNRAIKDSSRVKEFIASLPSVQRENGEAEEEKKETGNEKQEDSRDLILDSGKEEKQETINKPEEKQENWQDQTVDLNLKKEKLEATGVANFGAIPMPDIPETPNIIVGMVMTNEGAIVEGAIVEIQDEKGNPARVLKTNLLGQFKTSNPLSNGRYLMVTDKEGYKFDRVNIDLKGEIVQPIRIISN